MTRRMQADRFLDFLSLGFITSDSGGSRCLNFFLFIVSIDKINAFYFDLIWVFCFFEWFVDVLMWVLVFLKSCYCV